MSPRREGEELIQETEWTRVYRAVHYYRLESKLLADGLEVPASSLKQRWPSLTPLERQDFADAFIAKGVETTGDQEILTFLMEVGTECIWGTIAYRLPEYFDRERALSFLLERVALRGARPANYYQALARIGDAKAVPLLRQRYEAYRRELPPFEQHGLHSELSDYDVCCWALWKLTGSPEYENALKGLLTHPDENIRRRAHFHLFEQWP